ncbi:MAG TPA: hypothetical protein VFZ14_12035 [Burkholderiales bacterium]|nr:hypothetical protein [Burkholderiales bacterium]
MRLRVAWTLTAIWLIGIAAYLYAVAPALETWTARDFVAFLGEVAGPLALLWLVVGYFDHADALRRNSEALQKQAEQLELQVRGTRSLALVAVRQAEAMLRLIQLERRKIEDDAKVRMRTAQPRFILGEGVRHPRAGTIRLQNEGAPAANLALIPDNPTIKASIQPSAYVQSGGFLNIELEAPDFTSVLAHIEYSDAEGVRRRLPLRWSGDALEIGEPQLDAAA